MSGSEYITIIIAAVVGTTCGNLLEYAARKMIDWINKRKDRKYVHGINGRSGERDPKTWNIRD